MTTRPTRMTRRTLLLATLGAGALPLAPRALAQGFPSKQVNILVPFAAGGAVDILARKLADQLTAKWGRAPVVVNRPGAGGTVATQALLTYPADGHAFMLVANGHPLNQFFFEKLPYDTFKDFVPIVHLAHSPLAVVVSKTNAAPGLRAFLDAAKADPKGLSYGISGFGTSAHFAGILLAERSGTTLVPIPYRSGTQAMTAVLAGDIPMSINPLSEVLGQARAGAVRLLAVTTAARSPALPDVPAVTEAGYAGYDTSVWWGVIAPAGVPADVVASLNRDLNAALAEPAVRDSMIALGSVPIGSTPQAFDAFLRAEAAKWGPVIRAANVKLE